MLKFCRIHHFFLLLNFFFVSGAFVQSASVIDVNYQNDTSSPISNSSTSTSGDVVEASNATLGNGNIELECTPSGAFTAETRPETADCARALMMMPALAEFRTFTRGHNPEELYKLPKLFTQGRCQVTLDLIRGVNEITYGWMWMRMDASALALACHEPTGSSGKPYRTGGVTRAGPQQALEIRIKKSVRPQGTSDDDNGAAAGNSSTPNAISTS